MKGRPSGENVKRVCFDGAQTAEASLPALAGPVLTRAMLSTMRRTYSYRDVFFDVDVNVLPDQRFRWSFETDNGLIGKSEAPAGSDLEEAFAHGKEEAERAIARERG